MDKIKGSPLELLEVATKCRHYLINEFKFQTSKVYQHSQSESAEQLLLAAKKHGCCPPGRTEILGATLRAWGDSAGRTPTWAIKSAFYGLIDMGWYPNNETELIVSAYCFHLTDMEISSDWVSRFPHIKELVSLIATSLESK